MGPKSKSQKAAVGRLMCTGQTRAESGVFESLPEKSVIFIDEEELGEFDEIDSSDDDDSDLIAESFNAVVENTVIRDGFIYWNNTGNDIQYTRRGDSSRSFRRKRRKIELLAESAERNSSSILKFFKPAAVVSVMEEGPVVLDEVGSEVEENMSSSDSDSDNNDNGEPINQRARIQAALDKLKEDVFTVITRDVQKEKNSSQISKFSYLQLLSIKSYYEALLRGEKKCAASRIIAQTVFSRFGRNTYKSVSIRKWADFYLTHHALQKFDKQKHPRTKRIITDENNKMMLREYLRNIQPSCDRTPHRFWLELNNHLLATIPDAPVKISLNTARRWMIYLGFHAHKTGKNYYVDGHEREDVVQYREQVYLPQMLEYERRMGDWKDENLVTYSVRCIRKIATLRTTGHQYCSR
jgi:hypothetical protein